MTWLAYLWRHQVGLWPWTFSSVGVVKGRSVCHWFIGFQFPKQKSCWEFKSVCDCVQRGETHGLEDRLVRAEISFKVVLLNLAYITGILTHDMCGSSSGACHRKVCSKCRNLSHRIWVKFAPNAVAYSCIIKQVTSFYTQVTKGIKKNGTKRPRGEQRIEKLRETLPWHSYSASVFLLADSGRERGSETCKSLGQTARTCGYNSVELINAQQIANDWHNLCQIRIDVGVCKWLCMCVCVCAYSQGINKSLHHKQSAERMKCPKGTKAKSFSLNI